MLTLLARPRLCHALRRRRHPWSTPKAILGVLFTTSASSLTSTADSPKKASEPLRILFCGSDEFSCESLRALRREQGSNPELVEQVDVMVRPGKRTGRGHKILREVPCKGLAQELGLEVHERDTFRGWDIPQGTNLIIAVSFGLFVPPRILKMAKYGGLNVHPSLLPDLRGAAPLHHAILRGDEHIGVSLQTLDDTAFDHGLVLAQTPPPGLRIPADMSVKDLTQMMAKAGAEMLVQGLRDGVHVPPHKQAGWVEAYDERSHGKAPKVTKTDSRIDWHSWGVDDMARRLRVFDSLWSLVALQDGSSESRRVLFLNATASPPRDSVSENAQPDRPRAVVTFPNRGETDGEGKGEESGPFTTPVEMDERSGACDVKLADGSWVRFMSVKVEGRSEAKATTAMRPFFRTE